ncbi:hypothetical protein, partial [Candidatus Pantoea formicae]|uniref:hypothetical protein n=1 Tax=Candidatus Pantoea formicae TaxID=2608355 RepID=UPI0019662A3C
LRFPPSESNTFFSVFLRRDESFHSLLSRLRCRFAVSVVAHYRELFGADKGLLQKNYRSA